MSGVKVARSVDLAFQSILADVRQDVADFKSKADKDLNNLFDVRWEYLYLAQAVELQGVLFDNILSLHLLPRIIENDEELFHFTSGQDESRWDDPNLDTVMRRCLQTQVERLYPGTAYQTSYDVFLATLHDILYCLTALQGELQNARSFLSDKPSEANRTKWRTRGKGRERLVNSIGRCNTRLQDLLDPKREAPSMSQAQLTQTIKSEKKSSPLEFFQHAADLYDLFSNAWDCTCKMKHHFKLLLNHRSSAKVDFNILLLFEGTQFLAASPWTYRQMSFRRIEVEPWDMSKTKVRFKEPTPQPPPHHEVPQINNFCRALSESQASPRMGCLQEEGKCYDATYENDVSKPGEEESLAKILISRPPELTLDDRVSLAFTLASSVYQLYSTPWLRNNWSKQDIVFFRNGPQSAHFTWEEPYLSLDLWEKPTDAVMYPDTTILAEERLAIILLELGYNQPLEQSAPYKSLLPTVVSVTPRFELAAAALWVGDVRRHTSQIFEDVISWCLNKGFRTKSTRMHLKKWINEFYEHVVVPLQLCYDLLKVEYSKEIVNVEGRDSSINLYNSASKGGVTFNAPVTFRGSPTIGGMWTS